MFTEYAWTRFAVMISIVALLVSIGTCATNADAGVSITRSAVATPEGYEWSSDKGALRLAENKDVFIFDTYEALTVAKDVQVGWNVKKEESLTPLGKDLKGRLMKIEDIGSVYVGYRVIMFRKFPLVRSETLMQEIYKALE